MPDYLWSSQHIASGAPDGLRDPWQVKSNLKPPRLSDRLPGAVRQELRQPCLSNSRLLPHVPLLLEVKASWRCNGYVEQISGLMALQQPLRDAIHNAFAHHRIYHFK